MKLGQLGTHLRTELCVQVGQRLVKEEDLGVTDNCTAQSNTLTLTAGQSGGLTVKQMRDVEDLGSLFYAALDLILRESCGASGRTPCSQIRSYEDTEHSSGTPLRYLYPWERTSLTRLVVDVQLAFGNFFQTCNHTQRGGLTAAGRADQNDKFLIFDIKVEVG